MALYTQGTSADGLMEGPTAVMCEKGGRLMANSPHESVHDMRAQVRAFERLLLSNTPKRVAELRQVSSDSIQRLEDMIAIQESRVKRMRHQSAESHSETFRLRASMRDLLRVCKLTLQQIRESEKNLEISWAMLD